MAAFLGVGCASAGVCHGTRAHAQPLPALSHLRSSRTVPCSSSGPCLALPVVPFSVPHAHNLLVEMSSTHDTVMRAHNKQLARCAVLMHILNHEKMESCFTRLTCAI